MVLKSQSKTQKKLKDQAALIASDIASLMEQYADDSSLSKFYLPSEVADPILVTAGLFAAQLYPMLEPTEIANTAAFSMLYLAITYGFQTYLKEISIKTNSAPFRYPTDTEFIDQKRAMIYDLAERKELVTTDLSDEVFEIFLSNLRRNFIQGEFEFGEMEFDQELFFAYLGVSLYWGYNFAREVITNS